MKDIQWKTEVEVAQSEWKIGHQAKILTIGSCFAEVLGKQLDSYKFDVLNNPLGTIFNPLTIVKAIDFAMEGRLPSAELFLKTPDDTWLHHDFHSSQWAADQLTLETNIQAGLQNVRATLEEADLLVITLGTAYAYRHKKTNSIIGNCHKLPADQFIKELLHPDQISLAMEQLIHKLLIFRRNLKVVLTVSPVRHTRDTLALNQVSKSILRLACHRISEKYKHVTYFPSYEIMVDELRDYRFYESDLIHPNQLAEQYIFDRFSKAFIDTDTLAFMQDWARLMQDFNHRPQHGSTKSHRKFLKTLWSKLNEISRKVDVSRELEEIERRIGEFPLT